MNNNNEFQSIVERSNTIRLKYHQLEETHHGSQWSIEEDALAFLTDAGLVGRLIMDKEGRWPKPASEGQLEHKLAESMWWLIVMAERMDIDIEDAMEKFLNKMEKMLDSNS